MLLPHDQALEQAQYALDITSRATETNERSQRELAEVHAKLEARMSELAAVCLRLTDAEDGWAKSKAETDTLRAGTQAAASFVHDTDSIWMWTESPRFCSDGLNTPKAVSFRAPQLLPWRELTCRLRANRTSSSNYAPCPRQTRQSLRIGPGAYVMRLSHCHKPINMISHGRYHIRQGTAHVVQNDLFGYDQAKK